MKKLTKRQMLLAGLAISKATKKDRLAYFCGVAEGSIGISMVCSSKRWSAEDIKNSLMTFAKHLPNTPDAEKADKSEEVLHNEIAKLRLKAVEAYPSKYKETKKHILFDGVYYYEYDGGRASCAGGTTYIMNSPIIRYAHNNDLESARLLMDFYTNPCDPKVCDDYAQQIEEAKKRIEDIQNQRAELLLEDFIASGRCGETLKSMGINDFE